MVDLPKVTLKKSKGLWEGKKEDKEVIQNRQTQENHTEAAPEAIGMERKSYVGMLEKIL